MLLPMDYYTNTVTHWMTNTKAPSSTPFEVRITVVVQQGFIMGSSFRFNYTLVHPRLMLIYRTILVVQISQGVTGIQQVGQLSGRLVVARTLIIPMVGSSIMAIALGPDRSCGPEGTRSSALPCWGRMGRSNCSCPHCGRWISWCAIPFSFATAAIRFDHLRTRLMSV